MIIALPPADNSLVAAAELLLLLMEELFSEGMEMHLNMTLHEVWGVWLQSYSLSLTA